MTIVKRNLIIFWSCLGVFMSLLVWAATVHSTPPECPTGQVGVWNKMNGWLCLAGSKP